MSRGRLRYMLRIKVKETGAMSAKTKRRPRVLKPSTPANQDVSSALVALEEFIEDSTSSVGAATKSLKDAGILDKNGRLRKRYRS